MRSATKSAAPAGADVSLEIPPAPEPRSIEPRAARQDDSAQLSPALVLRQRLEDEIEFEPQQKWSPRRTLAFLVIANGMFWVGGFWLLAKILG